jgi:hypothetical protein
VRANTLMPPILALVNRTPRKSVRQELAAEVGFGCPAPGCGSPLLTWHHFDPPWTERQHHEPAGMIALCREHHDAADAGAYTVDDLRAMKADGRDRNQSLEASFEWRRHRLLTVVGGNFYYETPVAVQLRDRPVVATNRDGEGRMLLNVAMPSTVAEPRLRVDDNFWIESGHASQIESPPSGRLLSVGYPNGDAIRIEFFEVVDGAALTRRYQHAGLVRGFLENDEPEGYPITAVEVRMRVLSPTGNPVFDFDSNEMRVGGMQMVGCLSVRCGVGLQLG